MLEQFEDFIDEMKIENKSKNTIRSYEASIGEFLDYVQKSFSVDRFDIEHIRKITKKDILAYRNFLVGKQGENGKKLSPASVNTKMRPLSKFFNWLLELEYINSNPYTKIKAVKEGEKVPVFLTEEEQEKLLLAILDMSLRDRLMITMMLYLGIRRGEVVKIEVSDIDGNHILIRGKGKKQRVLALNEEIMYLLSEYLPQYNNKYLFVSERGQHQLSEESVRLIFNEALELSGINPERAKLLTPHKLRHTAAVNYVSKNIPLNVIQVILGHENTQTTQIYAHVRSDVVDKAMLG